jgi:hypothetical protein
MLILDLDHGVKVAPNRVCWLHLKFHRVFLDSALRMCRSEDTSLTDIERSPLPSMYSAIKHELKPG